MTREDELYRGTYVCALYRLADLQLGEESLHAWSDLFIGWYRLVYLLEQFAKFGGWIKARWEAAHEGC